jgi:hypothetical protein
MSLKTVPIVLSRVSACKVVEVCLLIEKIVTEASFSYGFK